MTSEAKLDRELEIVEKIRAGQADVIAGRVVSHEEVMAELDAIIDAAVAQKETTLE